VSPDSILAPTAKATNKGFAKDDAKSVRTSKTLSWLLRHKAKDFGLNVADDGYILLDEVLKLAEFKGVTVDEVRFVVDNNDKQRFSLKEESGLIYIRANQGHSDKMASVVQADKLLKKLDKPMPVCVHGTTAKAWKLIKKEGLNKMKRMHIHFAVGLSDDDEVISGYRKNSEVLIYVDMKKAMDDGIVFYMSDNKVILTEGQGGVLDPKYFKDVVATLTK